MFTALKKAMGEDLPACIKHILTIMGYSTFTTIKCLRPDSIQKIEKYFNTNIERFGKELQGTVYEDVRPFSFNPGHSALIESLPEYLKDEKKPAAQEYLPTFSHIMKLLIDTAEKNAGRNVKGNRYEEDLRNFATYIYLVCGRSCYETLSANLPIPSANTIREL